MKLSNFATAVLIACAPTLASAFVIQDIRIEGIQRTEPGTVFSYLPIKVGDHFSDDRAEEAIKALFATGFFNDVRIETEGRVVIVSIAERPIIADLDVQGSKEFDRDQIKKALRDNGLAESRIFDRALMDLAIQELKRQYYSRGKYSVEVSSNITPLARNRVKISLNIKEGQAARIKAIRFVGNEAFKSSTLEDEFNLSTGGWFSWLTKDNQYSRPKMTGDLEKLRAFYLNQGYFDFQINSTQVSISPDKKDIFLTINLSEGKKYTIKDVQIQGKTIVPEAELREKITLKAGEVFMRDKVNESVNAMVERLGEEGYAFANISAQPQIDKEKQELSFIFVVDPGRRSYVRRINIAGNTRTRDEVIRREMRQMEGAWYDAAKLKRSKERIDLLGYFTEINMETPPVAETTDQLDVNINVKEKPTGNLNLGAGYAQNEGLILSAGISQSNFFGSGKAVSASFNTSKLNRFLDFRFTDPYYTTDGMSLGYDIYTRRYTPDKIDRYNYQTDTSGFAMRWGVPVTEHDTVHFSLGAEHNRIKVFPDSPARYRRYVERFGETNLTWLGRIGWAQDTRDSALWPTTGRVLRINTELGLPGGDIEYGKFVHGQQWFFPITRNFTLALSGEIAVTQPYGKTQYMPFYQNLFLGGIGSLRGFESGSIGPQDENGDAFGGTRRLTTSAEILFPFPGMKDDKTVRTSLFVDAGALWGGEQQLDFSEGSRYSVGAAVSWLSPLGPMKFSLATPMKKEPEDKIQRFQFTLGTTF